MTVQDKPHTPEKTEELDAGSLAAIRDLLASETPVAPPRTKARRPAPAAADVPAARSAPTERVARPDPAPQPAEAPEPAPAAGRLQALGARFTGYRPKARHVLLASLLLLVVFRPWLVLAVVVLGLFVVTAIFLILGYDGCWRQTMRLARWYARRHPSRSIEIHRRLDAFAMKFDEFLDRFPEGTVDGLYLPDFGDLAEAEARHDAALGRRFEALRESRG